MILMILVLNFLIPQSFAKSSGSRIDIEDYSLEREGHSGVLFAPALTYLTISETNSVSSLPTASNHNRNLSFYDIKLGHVFEGGFYFGVAYAIESQDIDNGGPKTNRDSFGISAGYKYEGFLGIAHYYLTSKQKVTSTTDPVGDYSDGSGFQIDLSYHWFITDYFGIGPMLSYKSFSYKKAEAITTGTDYSSSANHSLFLPMVNMIFYLYKH